MKNPFRGQTLTKEQELDLIKTILGVNATLLKDIEDKDYIKNRNEVASIIVTALHSQDTLKYYKEMEERGF